MHDQDVTPISMHARCLPALPRKIFVVRHGQSTWNKTKRVSGQLNPPLSHEGWAQARRLAEVLREEALTAIFASTLCRAVETALPIARHHRLEITQCADLREQHLGTLQGRIRDSRDPEALELWNQRKADKLGFQVPDGESYFELERRLRRFVDEKLAQQSNGTVLIVGHRNSNRVLLGLLLDWPLREVSEIPLRSKYLYEIAPELEPRIRTISLRPRNLGDSQQGFHA